MSNGVTMEFPQADVDRLFKAMNYASEQLNIDNGTAMKRAVNSLINSIAASTRIAPAYREINERPNFTSPNSQNKAWAVTGWFGKPRRYESRLFYYRDLKAVKERHAKIGRRGLARLTWKMAAKKLADRLSISMPNISSAITNKIAAENIEAKGSFKGADIFAEIHNSLPYIRQALEGGPKDVNTAFDRAARGLEQAVDKQLVKRMGLGSLSR